MKTRRNTCVRITGIILLLIILIAGASAQAVPAQTAGEKDAGVTGEWLGQVSRLHMTLKIERAEGGLKATLISVDQGNISIPIDSTTFKADGTLRIEMPAINANYEGRLNADGSEIAGTFQQGGGGSALVFRRPGAGAPKFTLKPRTVGRIAMEPCLTSDGNSEALCGNYEVFENRETKKGRRITLKIMFLPAKAGKPEADPFFALAGGPGQSATQAFPGTAFVTRVREQRDVVLVDQRGTGGSNPLNCPVRRGDDAQSLVGEAFSLDRIRACRAESEKKADLTQYTTAVFIEDLDEVRQALGYDRINLFGGSYGTLAALVYLRRHEDHVRSISLEAVATPQYIMPLPFARAIQNSVDRLIARCAADAGCHKDYPDLESEFKNIVAGLDKAPAQFELNGQQVTLPREIFVSSLRSLLYIPQFVSAFPLIIHNASRGDWSIYGRIVLTLGGSLEGVIARGLSFAVICTDSVPAITDAAIRRDTEGTYLGDSQVKRYRQYCEAFGPLGPASKDAHAPVRSKVPALLISGALDPATPPEVSEYLLHDLTNARLIVIKEGTHGTGSPCIDGLIAEFVKQGTAKGLDASCTDQIHLPPFIGKAAGK